MKNSMFSCFAVLLLIYFVFAAKKGKTNTTSLTYQEALQAASEGRMDGDVQAAFRMELAAAESAQDLYRQRSAMINLAALLLNLGNRSGDIVEFMAFYREAERLCLTVLAQDPSATGAEDNLRVARGNMRLRQPSSDSDAPPPPSPPSLDPTGIPGPDPAAWLDSAAAASDEVGRTLPRDGRFAAAAVLHAAGLLPRMVVAEIGARRPPGETGFNEAFHLLPHARILSFEPDAEACEALEEAAARVAARPGGANISVIPRAVANAPGRRTLYVTRDPMCSSLFPPNERILRRYPELEVMDLMRTTEIDVVSLDQVLEAEGIDTVDFLKVDVQGAELEVMDGGLRALRGAVGANVEVEFVEMYVGQPLQPEVDIYMRREGFMIHSFFTIGQRKLAGTFSADRQQLMWADGLFFAKPKRWKTWERRAPEKLLKLAVFAGLYGAYDIAEEALGQYDAAAALAGQPGPELRAAFLRRIRNG